MAPNRKIRETIKRSISSGRAPANGVARYPSANKKTSSSSMRHCLPTTPPGISFLRLKANSRQYSITAMAANVVIKAISIRIVSSLRFNIRFYYLHNKTCLYIHITMFYFVDYIAEPKNKSQICYVFVNRTTCFEHVFLLSFSVLAQTWIASIFIIEIAIQSLKISCRNPVLFLSPKQKTQNSKTRADSV